MNEYLEERLRRVRQQADQLMERAAELMVVVWSVEGGEGLDGAGE